MLERHFVSGDRCGLLLLELIVGLYRRRHNVPRTVRGGLCFLKHDRPGIGAVPAEDYPMSALSSFVSHPGADLQSRFISVLPRIEDQARFYFRGVRCAMRRADCIAETVAVAWKWFCRLAQRGKDATQFAAALAHLAARAVRAGRRVSAGERANDVMSPLAQRRHGFVVQPLFPTRRSYEELNGDALGQRLHDVMEERLTDNTTTAPAEQAAFRLDFRAWCKKMTPRERRIIHAMATNERTKDLSQRFNVSAGRISQMRSQFRDDWRRFVGEIEVKVPAFQFKLS